MPEETLIETATAAPSGASSQGPLQTALSIAETLLPALLSAITAGATQTTPIAAVAAMVAEVIPPLIQSFGANSSQIQQLMAALVTQIQAGQLVIDQSAQSRGIPVQVS